MPWSPENEYLGFTPPKSATCGTFINANDRNFQVLRDLILRERDKFALINSALIYSRINLFP